jgi:hypothetical protein
MQMHTRIEESLMAKDLSHLPQANESYPPAVPVSVNTIGRRVHAAMEVREATKGEKPRAIPELPWRMSMAGSCMRANANYIAGVPRTNPVQGSDLWRMALGTMAHELVQELGLVWPDDAEHELLVDLRAIGIQGSGHSDSFLPTGWNGEGPPTLVEIKTINGYAFKKTAVYANATGPREGHKLQAALAAEAIGATRIELAYLSMELTSPAEAAKRGIDERDRFSASWVFDREEWIDDVNKEVRRLQAVEGMLAEAEANPEAEIEVPRYYPEMPAGARIINPKPAQGFAQWTKLDDSGNVVQTGNCWACSYCGWQDLCARQLNGDEAF